jgi:hypothetical protein
VTSSLLLKWRIGNGSAPGGNQPDDGAGDRSATLPDLASPISVITDREIRVTREN